MGIGIAPKRSSHDYFRRSRSIQRRHPYRSSFSHWLGHGWGARSEGRLPTTLSPNTLVVHNATAVKNELKVEEAAAATQNMRVSKSARCRAAEQEMLSHRYCS